MIPIIHVLNNSCYTYSAILMSKLPLILNSNIISFSTSMIGLNVVYVLSVWKRYGWGDYQLSIYFNIFILHGWANYHASVVPCRIV